MNRLTRRSLLTSTACGFGSIAIRGIASANGVPHRTPASNPLAAQSPPQFASTKRVIFIFMQGGPSQVDTFDYKPKLEQRHHEKIQFRDARKMARGSSSGEETIMKSLWKFRPYGETGHYVSDLFPQIAQHVDDLCFVHSMHTNGVAHGPSTLFLHTGALNSIRPSMGSWISYGLGTENNNLPGFVTIAPSSGNGGPRNYANAFLPACYQGTPVGRAEQPIRDAQIRHISNHHVSPAAQKEQFELLRNLNSAQLGTRQDSELEAVISSYELAWRMQQHAPKTLDLSQESAATAKAYGIEEKETEDFGRQCLMARRMAEAGVRFIQVNYSDNGSNPRWDQHRKIERHAIHAKATDQPVAALIADLKQRGLLEDTLVWWGGEFGRNPFTQGEDGRDHNPKGFTHFLVGGGVKRGIAYGATDEFGHEAIENKVHMHDLHATILHQLGLDHEQLTYRHAGRDFRLTDVEGRVIHDILS